MNHLIWNRRAAAVFTVRNRMSSLIITPLKLNGNETGYAYIGGRTHGEIQPRFLGNPDGPGDIG